MTKSLAGDASFLLFRMKRGYERSIHWLQCDVVTLKSSPSANFEEGAGRGLNGATGWLPRTPLHWRHWLGAPLVAPIAQHLSEANCNRYGSCRKIWGDWKFQARPLAGSSMRACASLRAKSRGEKKWEEERLPERKATEK